MRIQIQSGQAIVFIGDSITDARRREDCPPLGNGYVKLFADLLLIREPQKRVTIHNRGINGDRVVSGLPHIPQSGLINRWQRDVLDLKPDWLSIKIGINDVTSNLTPGVEPVTPEIYEREFDRLLGETRAALPACQLLLVQPFFMHRGPPSDPRHRQILDLLPAYVSAVERLSVKHHTRLVRTHALFQAVMAEQGAGVFGDEAIHPNQAGHLLIAEAVYGALSER
ncbi:MAG: SGNH/GDSL hydrolase family protein [Lentisphaerae bacterium]|nr:SGNH/GDSL hydrolase family protein [Lentisphaerota bacterium]